MNDENKISDQKEHHRMLFDNLAKVQNYKKYEYEVVTKFEKGDNYLGEIRRVKLKGVKQNDEEEILNLIIKTSPPELVNQTEIIIKTFYLREDFVYKDMFHKLGEFQNKFKIKSNEKFEFAKYYTAFCEDLDQSIIFEDLNAKGYKMYDRLKSLDYNHLMLIVKTLARFHALTFAAKEKMPNEFEEFKKHTSTKDDMSKGSDKYFADMSNTIAEYLEDAIDKVKFMKYFQGNMIEKYNRYVNIQDDPKDDPYFTITHGDSWINNMMFKYEGDNVTGIILLDWQLIKYCSPVTDLVYFFFSCTDEEIRLKAYDEVLDTYYWTLNGRLKELGCDPDKVYPEHVFRLHLKEYLAFGLLMASVIIPIVLNKREDALNFNDFLDENGVNSSVLKHSEKCKIRLKGVIKQFVNLGVI